MDFDPAHQTDINNMLVLSSVIKAVIQSNQTSAGTTTLNQANIDDIMLDMLSVKDLILKVGIERIRSISQSNGPIAAQCARYIKQVHINFKRINEMLNEPCHTWDDIYRVRNFALAVLNAIGSPPPSS